MFAPESRCAPGRLALLDHRDRDLAELLGQLGLVLEQLQQLDRAGEPGRAAADDRDADLDPLLLGIGDRVTNSSAGFTGGGNSAGSTGHLEAQPPFLALIASVSLGTILCRSPTTPRSQNSKIGAFWSLLIARMFSELCIPTLCWIAPEMPSAR